MTNEDHIFNNVRVRVSAKARQLFSACTVRNFQCGFAFEETDQDSYSALYRISVEDDVALLEYIAELEQKAGVAP